MEAESPVITPPAPSPDRTAKERLWQQKAAEVALIGDKLGLPIDSGIKETVIVANLLGVETDGSCEGHLDSATGAPYLDLHVTDTESELLENRRVKLFNQVFNSPEFAKLPEEERNKLNEEYDTVKKEVTRRNSENTQRMVGYLEEFSKGKGPLDGKRLVISPMGTLGASRLESEEVKSIGSAPEENIDSQARQLKLPGYQQEMRDFTEFLKGKFFGDNSQLQATSEPVTLEKLAA